MYWRVPCYCVLTSGCWNRGVPLYTEVSSLQGVGIEGFHCIQRCPHFRNRGVPLYTEVSSLQGVGIEGFHCIQRCPHSRVLEERGSTVYRGVLTSGCWKRGVPLYTVLEERGSTVYRGVLTSGCWLHCVLISSVDKCRGDFNGRCSRNRECINHLADTSCGACLPGYMETASKECIREYAGEMGGAGG